jgi:arginyl-tRNA synthetase
MTSRTTDAGPFEELASAVRAAAAAVRGTGEAPAAQPTLDRPRRKGLGDYSTNAAMLLAPVLGEAPRDVAARLAAELSGLLGDDLERVEVAGPGFLNLVLSDAWHERALRWMLDAGERFGAGGAERPERVLIEFVSANPTGPLVAASGRHAAYGDALARILEHHGHSVDREYYFNDAGNQIRLLGESVRARARGEEVPEGGYKGDYVAEVAASIPGAADADVDELARDAVDLLLARIKATLERYGVHFDVFFSERTLHSGSPSPLERALRVLEESGHVYRSEGALWLRTTDFGDDKDRVVVRSNGQPTYLAADIAYMQDKRDRGFELQLVPVGSDHAAYVREMKAAMAALGGDPNTVELPLLQFVHLVAGGEVFAMSKRRGAFVTLDDLIDAIGVDATRFFMLRSSHDRTIELDVALARKQSRENPVFYVQYAHARIASMLRRLPEERASGALAADWDSGSAPLEDIERDLIKKLLAFPAEVAEAAARRAPHRITGYALELAQDFTAFYEHCRVIGVTPESLESRRIALSAATQRTIALSLGLLGVSAPDSM